MGKWFGAWMGEGKDKTPEHIRKFAAELVRGNMDIFQAGPMHIAQVKIVWPDDIGFDDMEPALRYLRQLGFKITRYNEHGVDEHIVSVFDIDADNPLMEEVRIRFTRLWGQMSSLVIAYLLAHADDFHRTGGIEFPNALGDYNLRYVNIKDMIFYVMASDMFQILGLIREGNRFVNHNPAIRNVHELLRTAKIRYKASEDEDNG